MELFRSFGKLVRQYQFRDREELSCHGVSVSQCYTLSMLRDEGPSTMGEVASALFLDLSTATRLVDQLERRGLIQRARGKDDRRVCRVSLTRKGSALVRSIGSELVQEYRIVLQSIPPAGREAVLAAIRGLATAFEQRARRAKAQAVRRGEESIV